MPSTLHPISLQLYTGTSPEPGRAPRGYRKRLHACKECKDGPHKFSLTRWGWATLL
jgi:hypothetical protein